SIPLVWWPTLATTATTRRGGRGPRKPLPPRGLGRRTRSGGQGGQGGQEKEDPEGSGDDPDGRRVGPQAPATHPCPTTQHGQEKNARRHGRFPRHPGTAG